MPLVKIEMRKGKSPDTKKKILDIVHEGLIEALSIEDWDRFQRIFEYDKENFEIPEGKTDDFMIIELTIFPGRTREQKSKAVELITQRLNEELNIPKTDVFIIINEPPKENWGLAGKTLA